MRDSRNRDVGNDLGELSASTSPAGFFFGRSSEAGGARGAEVRRLAVQQFRLYSANESGALLINSN